MLTKQEKWNRYVDAINYLISNGYFVFISKESKNGNVKQIRVKKMINAEEEYKECIINLEARKYKPKELLYMVQGQIG